MANKKTKDEKKPRFEVKKRTTKEKPDFFQNIPSMRHPLAEILDFPGHSPTESDNQNINEVISKNESTGYPKNFNLDSQNFETGHPNPKDLDSQKSQTSYPNNNLLDSQKTNTGHPNIENQDSQTIPGGYPNTNNLDSNISKKTDGLSKKKGVLDSNISKTPKQDSQKRTETGKWEKYDKKRKSKGVFLRTGEEITKKFKQFCIANDWDFSHGTEVAWNKLMADLAIQKPGALDSLIALDDRRLRMLYKTKPLIINLYLAYNTIFNEFAGGKSAWKARWSPRDDEAAYKFNDSEISLIELGIIQTQMNKGIGQGRIQTFKYYTDEIENFLQAEINPETAKTILEVNRKMWKNQLGKDIDLSFLDSQDK